jgi:outer membrane receptor protein involved in Fe transport
MTRKSAPYWAGVAAVALTPCVAFAQGGPGEAGGEIVVTAQFRPQDPIAVPFSLTALGGETLERIGVDDFEELARFVPGFEVQNQSPNNPGFVMRGITSDAGSAFEEPRVSVFQDGVSMSKSRGAYVELFDLERVEVAKGPQTTLYGRSALIGAVNIIQNKADPTGIAASARGEIGNRDHRLAEAMVNLPIGESAAVRLAGRWRQRDGDVPNLLGGRDYGSTDSWAVRGAFRLAPSDRLRVDVIGNYQHDEPSGTAFLSLPFSPTDPVTGAVLGPPSPFGGGALTRPVGFEGGRDLGIDRDVWGVTALAELELSDRLKLNSVTAYRRFKALEVLDADGISLPVLTAAEDARGRQFSQDFRLSWDDDGPIDAFVGASYFRESGSQRTPTFFDERVLLARLAGALNGLVPGRPASAPAPLALLRDTGFDAALLRGLAGAQGVALPGLLSTAIASNLKTAHLETATNFGRTRSWDLFGDVTFHVSSQFELGGSIRYTRDRKRSAISARVLNGRSILGGFLAALGQPEPNRTALLAALGVPGAADIPFSLLYPVPLFGLAGQPTANNGDRIENRLSDDGITYRLTARYAPDEDLSIYAGYARGRRPEELSVRTPVTPGAPPRFDTVLAETVDSFELGAKAALASRTLFVDGALFHYRYKNFQTTIQSGVLFVTTNAGKARSYGFEGQVRWHATDEIELFASYAYNHSRFRTGVRRGNRFRLSPDHSFAVGANLSLPLAQGSISFTPTITYQSKTFFDSDNDRPELQQPPNALVPDNIQDEFQKGFALVNARLGYGPEDGRWRVEAFAENIFNKHYIKDAGNTGDAIGLATAVPGARRLYGIAARVRFGTGN